MRSLLNFNIKYTGAILFIIATLSTGCSKKEMENFMDKGTITGVDMRECACCGGYFIEINSQTYRFYNLPDNSSIELKIFPIEVELDWKESDHLCLGDEIIIDSIKLR